MNTVIDHAKVRKMLDEFVPLLREGVDEFFSPPEHDTGLECYGELALRVEQGAEQILRDLEYLMFLHQVDVVEKRYATHPDSPNHYWNEYTEGLHLMAMTRAGHNDITRTDPIARFINFMHNYD